jgi:hypothetical protein
MKIQSLKKILIRRLFNDRQIAAIIRIARVDFMVALDAANLIDRRIHS